MNPTTEAAFEAAIEAHLLANGYVAVPNDGFDRDRTIFPRTVLDFVLDTEPDKWTKLKFQLDEQTSEQFLADPRKLLYHRSNLIRCCSPRRSRPHGVKKLRKSSQLSASLLLPLQGIVAAMLGCA